jgi:hypothetical protein
LIILRKVSVIHCVKKYDDAASMRVAIALPLAALVAACGAELPEPVTAVQPATLFVTVPYPPPPARVESVPESPIASAVWIDGEWAWRRSRWAWKPGRWVVPPANAFYLPWTIARADNGELSYAPGAWRAMNGAVVTPPALATATVVAGSIVDPEGDEETTGSNVKSAPGRR